MISEYITREEYNRVRWLLTGQNRLVIDLCMSTGLRVGDAVSLSSASLMPDNTIFFTASKTGKKGNAKISKQLADLLRSNSDSDWLFPSSTSETGHRTRQAVWKNLVKCCASVGLDVHFTPHSARKTFAVELMHKKGLKAVQKALQHDKTSTTAIYAYSDVLRSQGDLKPNDHCIIKLLEDIYLLLKDIYSAIYNKNSA